MFGVSFQNGRGRIREKNVWMRPTPGSKVVFCGLRCVGKIDMLLLGDEAVCVFFLRLLGDFDYMFQRFVMFNCSA